MKSEISQRRNPRPLRRDDMVVELPVESQSRTSRLSTLNSKLPTNPPARPPATLQSQAAVKRKPTPANPFAP